MHFLPWGFEGTGYIRQRGGPARDNQPHHGHERTGPQYDVRKNVFALTRASWTFAFYWSTRRDRNSVIDRQLKTWNGAMRATVTTVPILVCQNLRWLSDTFARITYSSHSLCVPQTWGEHVAR